MRKTNKISVIGAGFVGSAVTFALVESGIASDIVLVDVNKEKAEGEVMDISHGAAFVKAVNIKAGDYRDTVDSDIVIVTAGAGQKVGETRLDLINKNVAIFKSIIPPIVRYSPNCVLLIVANPVDILTYIAFKLSGFPASRVIGSGTVLDSSRLRHVLAQKFDIAATNVHAHIVGEHGDSEFPAWSSAFVGSVRLEDYCVAAGINPVDLTREVAEEVKNSAYQIIERKGYTNYAIALAVRRITEAVLRDDKSILSISTYDAIEDMYYSVPTIVGKYGKISTIVPQFSPDEQKKLEDSKAVLRDAISLIDLK